MAGQFGLRNLFRADFVRETCCMWIFLFLKPVNWFSLRDWFRLWRFLHADFNLWAFLFDAFYSWNLLHIGYSLRETCILIFPSYKLILFVELVAFWFLFVKLVGRWIFHSWNLYIDFSPRETDFVHGTFSVLIFVLGGFCVLILFVKPVACWFFLFEKLVHWFFLVKLVL